MFDFEIERSYGDALFNADACFPDLEWLSRDFDILYFLDFCVGLEASVVHNSLITVGTFPSESANPVASRLRENGALRAFQIESSNVQDTARNCIQHPIVQGLFSVLPSYIEAAYKGADTSLQSTAATMAMDLVLEDSLSLPFVTSAHQSPMYMLTPKIRAEHQVQKRIQETLAETYSDFRENIQLLREQVDGVDQVRIPPIALEILDAADTWDQIGDALLEVRDKYSNLRTMFSTLDETLRSTSISPKKKHEEKYKLLNSISTLYTNSERDRISTITSTAEGANETIDIDGFRDGIGLDDVNYGKIVGHILQKGKEQRWKYYVRPLLSTKKSYFETSADKVNSVVRKHFGHDVNGDDIAAYQTYHQRADYLLARL